MPLPTAPRGDTAAYGMDENAAQWELGQMLSGLGKSKYNLDAVGRNAIAETYQPRPVRPLADTRSFDCRTSNPFSHLLDGVHAERGRRSPSPLTAKGSTTSTSRFIHMPCKQLARNSGAPLGARSRECRHLLRHAYSKGMAPAACGSLHTQNSNNPLAQGRSAKPNKTLDLVGRHWPLWWAMRNLGQINRETTFQRTQCRSGDNCRSRTGSRA